MIYTYQLVKNYAVVVLKNYIYLDWNVIQYMKHETPSSEYDSIKFKEFVEKFKRLFRFPASEGHLRDLTSGFNEANREYIYEDLQFLTELSDGYMLGVRKDDSLIVVEGNVFSEFEKILSEKEEPFELHVTGGKYQIDMSKLAKDSMLRPFLEENSGTLDAGVMQKLLEMMYDKIDDPKTYKHLRNEVSKLKDRFQNNDTLLDQESDYFKKIETYFEFHSISELSTLEERFIDILSSFLAIDGRSLNNLTKGELIQNAYMILDMHPLFQEKINKKNKPDNLYRDVKNLFFASNAKYYVTQDQATYKKSKFVAKMLGLKVRIMKMDDLRTRLFTSSDLI